MDPGIFFPFYGMADPIGALLPALISLVIVACGRARSGLARGDQFWLFVFSLTLSFMLARGEVSADETALYIIPGATFLVCYLAWCGHRISPGLAFVMTYATLLPVDYSLARVLAGADFDPSGIGGGGWRDGLLVLPTLTALAIAYANWRMSRAVRVERVLVGVRARGLDRSGPLPG